MSLPPRETRVKVAVASLGCDKNRVDTETMLGLLSQAGYEFTGRESLADVILVNTCAFIDAAQEEAVNTILDLAAYKRTGRCRALVVTGCLAQRYGPTLLQEIPEIDGLVGTGQLDRIAEVTGRCLAGEKVVEVGAPGYAPATPVPRLATRPPYTTFIKIAEGCSNCCRYCIIPRLRGPFRSRPPDTILEEARRAVACGCREIVLVAQDTTRYGADLGNGISLAYLVKALARLPGVRWVRILYCYPTGITDDLLEVIATEPAVCNYLDIPMQHASDKVLKAMGRPTTQADLRELLARVRAVVPGITIRSTFMVGYPGETEKDFEELLAFLKEMRLERAGFFVFSAQEGTPAARMPGQVPSRVRQERLEKAVALQKRITFALNREKTGRNITVLVEGRRGKRYLGRSEADAPEVDGRVFFRGSGYFSPGDFAVVHITKAYPYDLEGESVGPSMPSIS
ncbi:MAG: 30S ribosomal protein S12 methylthiotransferase RimO [Bacillota bacterium]